MPRSVLSSSASLLPHASATSTRWTSLLHQGRTFPIVVVHGGTVGGRGIALQPSRIGVDGVNFFRRPAVADPGRHPGAKLAQRLRCQAHRPPLHGQRRLPWYEIRPRDRQEPQLAIGLFHPQRVAAVPFDHLDLLAVERMDWQPDRRHGPAREVTRPRVLRRARLGFGSALCLSVSGASEVR